MRELEEVEDQRIYGFFSVIAGVRNNAGVSPIVPPRGLPSDLSIGASETLLTIGHDPSWLLLREILDFDWFGDRLDLQWTWMTRKRWSLFESPNGSGSGEAMRNTSACR